MQKPVIIFSKASHKGKEVLLINFKYNLELKEYLKEFKGICWSTDLRSFYLSFDKEVTNTLFKYLRAKDYFIDYSALRTKRESKAMERSINTITIGREISNDVLNDIKEFKKWMGQKRYSKNTMNTYESMLLLFFRFQHPKAINTITEKDIFKFNTDYIMAKRFSYTYQNQAINAIKLFYRNKSNSLLVPENLERPKKSRRLPDVLAIEEIKLILGLTSNLKHRTLLSLIYSCGLRIGEALKLKVRDIDRKRRFMHIRAAKGAKDRYVPIPVRMIVLLTEYIECYGPENYLFEGQNGGMYTAVSARQVLKRSLQKAGIRKSITLHTLRHSHATHLLENGTDLRFIQELLGHNSPKTTMIYTHVSTTSLDKIKNPFDDFDL
ncbi:tyrosine-type recombinase/integrase [Maribacter cobaltidurans]|uniref:Uncharacterized protein n=1 Tax=Maribacter cobaltidurans TaxID=1178778 RepID=A0A223V9E5_9FLAO|nr:tyrosine-type recombinase/integrase [Maribacter cobaltidurans]ASV31499.1 hypothetical protein CJ263_15465 [Maribacter cobaltidurans]GGD96627.1 integrase [Maribacter cobaltidurans]